MRSLSVLSKDEDAVAERLWKKDEGREEAVGFDRIRNRSGLDKVVAAMLVLHK